LHAQNYPLKTDKRKIFGHQISRKLSAEFFLMAPSVYTVFGFLFLGIACIVLLTARLKLHPFFALLIASMVVGLGVGFSMNEVLTLMKEGFGGIMRSLALVIVLGTALGILLERTGSTRVMAAFILKKIGPKYPVMAMSITGFVIGMPLFCDSGFIVLSGLNSSIAKKTGTPVIIMAVAMATGLYAVHCLIPPHPGAAAAASTIGVDYGRLMLLGILTAIPAMLIGNWYARVAGKKIADAEPTEKETAVAAEQEPAVLVAFLPVIVPVILIAAKSLLVNTANLNPLLSILSIAGDPVIALSVGVLLALYAAYPWKDKAVNSWLQEGAEKAGGILVIIGAGGAFGAVLAATQIGKHFSEVLPLAGMGLLFPFLLSFVLKTAQGSSTVAIITAASIIQPLLPTLGFITPDQKLLCVLSMGAGSMMISHANDAYFWVIARFEKIAMRPMLRVYTVSTILMGLTSLLMVYLLSLLL
jgi:GntP family gluconate:H+ symporter